MLNELVVSPSPHRRGSVTTQKIMAMVIAALLPSAIAGCVIFGLRALVVILTCVASCVVFEILCYLVMKRTQKVYDLSAIVTGLLLGLNLTASIPLYICVIGSFAAIVIAKQLFGGIGQNFANPAIAARLVLVFSFTSAMNNWVDPFYYKNGADAVSGATPLAANWLAYAENGENYKMAPFTLREMFLGLHGGCIGEVCAAALIAGGIFLIVTRVISFVTPVTYIGAFALLTLVKTQSFTETLYQVLAGGLLIGAFFMATDYATSPFTNKGKFFFALGCAAITFVIRQFGSFPEGVSFSILLMNLLTPYIDRLTRTKPFGAKENVRQTPKDILSGLRERLGEKFIDPERHDF